MREIVTVQVGQCGNRVGHKFWEVISNEHGIGPNGVIYSDDIPSQLKRISVYFRESYDGRYIPRAVLTDLETGVLDSIQSAMDEPFFETNNFIAGMTGAGNNFAKGHYLHGVQLFESVGEIIRDEVEHCESIQGFQMLHSLGGGSGSGYGTLLLTKIEEDFSDCLLHNFSIIPSTKVSDIVVEPYNTILSLRHLIDYSNAVYCIDNEALFNICFGVFKERTPLYSDLNHIISIAMSGITTCFRFPSDVNSDLRKLAVNMIPFPKLHFFMPGFAPLIIRSVNPHSRAIPVRTLARGMFDPNQMLVDCNPRGGRYLTVAVIFRGMFSVKEVEQEMSALREKNKSFFTEWLANNMKISICEVPSRGLSESATIVGNSTSITEVFKRVLNQYDVMLRRKAFLHWYTGEGMEEDEFRVAEEAAVDLIADYEQYQSP